MSHFACPVPANSVRLSWLPRKTGAPPGGQCTGRATKLRHAPGAASPLCNRARPCSSARHLLPFTRGAKHDHGEQELAQKHGERTGDDDRLKAVMIWLRVKGGRGGNWRIASFEKNI